MTSIFLSCWMSVLPFFLPTFLLDVLHFFQPTYLAFIINICCYCCLYSFSRSSNTILWLWLEIREQQFSSIFFFISFVFLFFPQFLFVHYTSINNLPSPVLSAHVQVWVFWQTERGQKLTLIWNAIRKLI